MRASQTSLKHIRADIVKSSANTWKRAHAPPKKVSFVIKNYLICRAPHTARVTLGSRVCMYRSFWFRIGHITYIAVYEFSVRQGITRKSAHDMLFPFQYIKTSLQNALVFQAFGGA